MSSSEEAITDDELPWEQGSLLPDGLGVLPLQWVHPAERVARGAATAAARRGDANELLRVAGPDKQGTG